METSKKIRVSPSLTLSDLGELIQEILILLPTKSLFRCKCVCKEWESLISHPSFVERVKSRPPLITGFFCCNHHDKTSFAPDIRFCKIGCDDIEIDGKLSFLGRIVVPVASHNGLLLCGERPDDASHSHSHSHTPCVCGDSFDCIAYPSRYILCNPYTKQWVVVPRPACFHYTKHIKLYTYEKEQQIEFKIVACFVRRLDAQLEVYTSEIGKWNIFRISHDFGAYGVAFPSFLLEESLCIWNTNTRRIILYNLKQDSVSFPESPLIPAGGDEVRLFSASAGSIQFYESDQTHFRVWVLVDGVQWSLKHKVLMDDMQLPQDFKSSFLPMAFHPYNTNIVFVKFIFNSKVAIYYSDEKRVEFINDVRVRQHYPVISYSCPAWPPNLWNHRKHLEQ